MRILYISPVNLRKRKGASTHFAEVGKGLQQRGNTVLMVCQGKGGRNGNRTRKKGSSAYAGMVAKIRSNRIIRTIARSLLYLPALLCLDLVLGVRLVYHVIRFKPDVVYHRGVTYGGVLCRGLGLCSVGEANGIYPDEVQTKWPGLYRLVGPVLHIREKLTYTGANAVICVTDGIKRELASRYGVEEARCIVIPNGVNTALFTPADRAAGRAKLGLEPELFYLGFVGAFRPWQGLDTLVRAMKKAKERGLSKARCLLVGDGENYGYLKDLAEELGVEQEVVFLGTVEYDTVPEYISVFDVCLAPFTRGRNIKIGLSPLKLYEYLACARPVIASRVEGVSEVVDKGNCGYLFEPDDTEDLCRQIVTCFKERASLNRLGENGRMFVEQHFSWEKIAGRVEEVLQRAIAA